MSQHDRDTLNRHAGTFTDGYTPADIDQLAAQLGSIELLCVWDTNNAGPTGSSELVARWRGFPNEWAELSPAATACLFDGIPMPDNAPLTANDPLQPRLNLTDFIRYGRANLAPRIVADPNPTTPIRDRLANASPAPWRWTPSGHDLPTLEYLSGGNAPHLYWDDVIDVHHDGGCGCRMSCTLSATLNDENKTFIENAPADLALVLSLLDGIAQHIPTDVWVTLANIDHPDLAAFAAAHLTPPHQHTGQGEHA